jgi:hypothetical protein
MSVAIPAAIRVGWKWIISTNVLAYSTTELITAVKGLSVQALVYFWDTN